MQRLGYGAKNTYNRYCFEEATPVSNLFLDLKYMIERDGAVEECQYFDVVSASGNVYLLRNNAYLPLGFLTEVQLANVDFSGSGSTFSFQNKLLRAASGIRGDILITHGRDTLEISSDDVNIRSKNGNGYCTYETSESSGTVVYTFTPDREGFMCLELNLPKKNSYSVYLNGEKLYSETYSLPQCIAVSDVNVGDVVEVKFTCKANESSNMTVTAAYVNEERFRNAYNILAASTLELSSFSNTNLEGTIHCNRDGLLYTSIPQNGNWSAKIDGKDADIILIGDCMIALPITQGEHTITFSYRNAAFSLGWKITLVCVLVFLTLCIGVYLPKRRKGKYEK